MWVVNFPVNSFYCRAGVTDKTEIFDVVNLLRLFTQLNQKHMNRVQ